MAKKKRREIKLPVFGVVPLDLGEIIKDLKSQESPLYAQFFKYICCGVCSMVIFALIVASCEILFPDYLNDNDPIAIRQKHTTVVMLFAFIISNFTAYFLNRKFVFKTGKHSVTNELLLFTFISGISFAGGELAKYHLINHGYSNLVVLISFAISSALVNFVARKFFVFSN